MLVEPVFLGWLQVPVRIHAGRLHDLVPGVRDDDVAALKTCACKRDIGLGGRLSALGLDAG
jgi:hypothetical protein